MWYESKVFTGNKQGREIGYPTINLDASIIPEGVKKGVYAAFVKYNGKIYKGALFYGPRAVLGEKNVVLEIYVFDFAEEIYNQTVSFQIRDYIREVKTFESLDKLKEQIQKDLQEIKLALNK